MDGRAVAPSSGGSLPLYRLAAASSAAGPRREAHAETAEFAGLLADARLRQRGGGAWRAPSAAARRGRPRAALLVAALVAFVCVSVAGSLAAFLSPTNARLLAAFYRENDVPAFFMGLWLPSPCPQLSCAAGRAWAIAHASAGYGAWLVWLDAGVLAARLQLMAYALSLALTTAWADVLFGLGAIGAGAVLAWMWAAAVVCSLAFFSFKRRVSALFLVPQLLVAGYCVALSTSVALRGHREQPP